MGSDARWPSSWLRVKPTSCRMRFRSCSACPGCRSAPGQAHELPHAVPLLERLPGVPKWVVADRGLSSHAFREPIWSLGARPVIPAKRNEEEVACPDWIYANRNESMQTRGGWSLLE